MKKTIFFILIMCGWAFAQPYVGFSKKVRWQDLTKSVQDSIQSSENLDNVQSAVTAATDTIQLKLLSATNDSLGTMRYLEKLASGNPNGGGWFVYADSATMRTEYGATIVSDGVSYKSSTAGNRWFRQTILDRQPISPYYFGALGDNSNDDTAELQAAENAAEGLSLPLYLGDGTFKITTAITLSSGNDIGFIMYGNGISRTKINAVGSGGLIIPSGQQDNMIIKDFELERSVAGADTGILITNLTGALFQNLKIDNFHTGIYATTIEDNMFENIGGGADTFGIVLVSNSNGNTIARGGFTADSIAYVMNASHGNLLQSLDLGNHPYSLKLENISDAQVYSGQYESHSKAVFWIENNCRLQVFGGRTQGSASSVLLLATGASAAAFYSHDITGFAADSLMVLGNYSPDILWYDEEPQVLPTVYISTDGRSIPIGKINSQRPISFGGGVDRGEFFALWRAPGDGQEDALLFGLQLNDDTTIDSYLSDGNDWRYDSNGADSTHGGRFNRMRYYFGKVEGTTSAGDSTVVSVWTDTSGVASYTYFGGTVDRTSPDATVMDAHVSQLSNNTGTGEVKFLIWHKSDTGGGINYRLNYLIIAQALVAGQW